MHHKDHQTTWLTPQAGVIYSAVGRVQGTYRPDEADFRRGVLLTPDGLEFAARLSGRLLSFLQKHHVTALADGSFFQQPHYWGAYPKTFPELRFDLMRLWDQAAEQVDRFRVVGTVTQTNQTTTILRLWRNQPNPHQPEERPASFTLKLQGSLPPEALKQAWQIEAVRVGKDLKIDQAAPAVPKPEPVLPAPEPNTQTTSESNLAASMQEETAATDSSPVITIVQDTPIAQPASAKPKRSSNSRPAEATATTIQPTYQFQVHANQQIFSGNQSVHLKGGMLVIDGKPVARAKVAIVQGNPQQCSADGQVQRSGAKTVLIGR